MGLYSCGPFSRVYILHTRDGLVTYTNSLHRLHPTGTAVHTILSEYTPLTNTQHLKT